MSDRHAPLLKYFRIYVVSYLTGLSFNLVGGPSFFNQLRDFDRLNYHKMRTAANYTKPIAILDSLKESFYVARKPAGVFAFFFTTFAYILNKFKDWEYSTSQSIVRTCAILSPVYLLFRMDRPFTNLWYRSATLWACSCKNIYRI